VGQHYWSADHTPELVADSDSLGNPQHIVLPQIGIQGRVAQIVIDSTVDLVRAAFGNDIDLAAYGAAILGVEGAALDLELLNGVEIRRRGQVHVGHHLRRIGTVGNTV